MGVHDIAGKPALAASKRISCDTVHMLVRNALRHQSEREALSQDGRTVSRLTLDDRSERLAHYLNGRFAAPRQVMAVCLARSTEQVVVLLAVLKAGAAFLILDPGDPAARIRDIVEDAKVSAIITDADHAHIFAGNATIVRVDADAEHIDGTPLSFPLPAVDGNDLAYVVYTSGSTGAPNGVEITHRNLLNFIAWAIECFDITEEDRSSHLISLGFDVAVSEIWPYLVAGCPVVIVDETVRTSPELLRRWLIRERITIATVPMTFAEVMLSADWPVDTALRLVLTGGDVLRAYPRRVLPFDLVNNYGPSECTIVSTAGRVPVHLDETASTSLPTIGAPISGVAIHILDEHHQPVRLGQEGEIWIGGEGVGRGYRNRPELTRQRFVPDTFGPDPRGHIYKSGDRGILLPDGEIEFRGRIDRQTKIRGVRVELDEIAIGLQRHPKIGSAVVIAREDGGTERHLVAYFVPTSGGASSQERISAEELRGFLAGFLPRNYVPGRYVMLGAMPLTRNGKIDYEALPAPDAAELQPMDADRRVPATPTEVHLARIIEGVLGKHGISADDDFFLNGGHSILATQVVIQSREAFGVELTLLDIFETPTIAGLAGKIEQRIDDRIGAMTPQEIQVMLSHVAP
ncbi:non-ribosomal peptide synthetase [Sphingomonas oryzagri]